MISGASPLLSAVEPNHDLVASCSYSTFVNLIHFLYTDTVDVGADGAIELFVAADLYTMTRLKVRKEIGPERSSLLTCATVQDLCETIVRKGITVDNAALLLATAHSLSHAQSMMDLCLRCVARPSWMEPLIGHGCLTCVRGLPSGLSSAILTSLARPTDSHT